MKKMHKLINKLNNTNYVDDEILNNLYLNINGKENKIILKI